MKPRTSSQRRQVRRERQQHPLLVRLGQSFFRMEEKTFNLMMDRLLPIEVSR